jgi:glycerate kinase
VSAPRRIVIAPDSFKGSISAADAAASLAEGWASVQPDADFVLRPMADGGEGTVAAFEAAVDGAVRHGVIVDGPTGAPISSSWLWLPPTPDAPSGTGVVDLASTSGIELLDELRPWDADTIGFGQAISAALDAGVSRLVLGIGSSASTDGGIGLLTALGARFLDRDGLPVAPGAAGLCAVVSVDHAGLAPVPDVRVLTDVTNPLIGERGAAAVFGPQKGLTDPHDIREVDAALARLADLLHLDPEHPGTGAAGGAGAALVAWGATLTPGAGAVAELIGLSDAIAGADAVVTGEGSFDGQSGDGKVPSFVADLAQDSAVPVFLAAGRITADADTGAFAATASLTDLAGSAAASQADAARWLRAAGAELARIS